MDEESRRDLIALLQLLRAQWREYYNTTHPRVTQLPAELVGGGGAEAPRDDDGLLPGHRDDEFHDEVADMLNPGPFGYIHDRMLEFTMSPPVPGEDDGDDILEQFYRAATGDGRLPAGPPELDQQPYYDGGFGGVPAGAGEEDGDGILEQFYRAATGDGRLPPADPPPELDQQPYAYGGFGGVPACAEVIAGLEKQKYNGSGEDGDKECSICMMDYAVGDDQTVMPCKHKFHQKCLAGWLALSHLCPLCRHVLPPAEEQDVP